MGKRSGGIATPDVALSLSIPRGGVIENEKELLSTIIAEVPSSRRTAKRETREFRIINDDAS